MAARTRPLSGYLLLGEKLYQGGQKYAEAWNFGPAMIDAVTTAELAARVQTIWGKGSLRIQPRPNALHEATYLRLDCEKSLQHLGWRPRLRLEHALEWTVEWYQNFYESPASSPRELTERQIQAYIQAATP